MVKLTTPQRHQKKIAISTLKMSDAGANVMGGMTKSEAKTFLKSIGYSNKQIKKLEESTNKLRSLVQLAISEYFDENENDDDDDDVIETSSVSSMAGSDGYQTPHAFSKRSNDRTKEIAQQLGYILMNKPEERDWDDLENVKKETLVYRKKLKETQLHERKFIIELPKDVEIDQKDFKQFVQILKKNKIKYDIGLPFNENINEGRRGRYHEYRDNKDLTTRQKIGNSLQELRNKLTEIEKTVDLNLRLKQETGIDSGAYWKRTHRALNRITEKMTRIMNKIRRF